MSHISGSIGGKDDKITNNSICIYQEVVSAMKTSEVGQGGLENGVHCTHSSQGKADGYV